MHRKVVAALVAALALGIASCGGSEGLTREDVVSRIETACRQAETRTQQAARDTSDGGSEGFLTGALAGQRQLTRDIEEIQGSDDVPDDVADELETLKTNFAERTDLIASVAEAPRAEQPRAMQAINDRATVASERIEGALRRLGVRECELA